MCVLMTSLRGRVLLTRKLFAAVTMNTHACVIYLKTINGETSHSTVATKRFGLKLRSPAIPHLVLMKLTPLLSRSKE
jgi:hypothetical protein